jgi:hypothetical protein
MPHELRGHGEALSVQNVATPVRGAIDEKNDVYRRAIQVEEGEDDEDSDLEAAQAPRPELRLHSVRIGLVMILVVLTQSLGVSKVRNNAMPLAH